MENFANVLISEGLDDLLVAGFVDKSDYLQFHPMYERVFFLSKNKVFELSLNHDAISQIKVLPKIEPWFDIDEEDEFAIMSIYSQAFKTESSIEITAIDFPTAPLKPISIHYNEGELMRSLRLDPASFWGFMIG